MTPRDIIAAALTALGTSVVVWRRPEEFVACDRDILIFLGGDHGVDVANGKYGIHPRTLAWAEKPAPPAWTDTAPPVASAQSSEAIPVSEAAGDAHNAPVADQTARPPAQNPGAAVAAPSDEIANSTPSFEWRLSLLEQKVTSVFLTDTKDRLAALEARAEGNASLASTAHDRCEDLMNRVAELERQNCSLNEILRTLLKSVAFRSGWGHKEQDLLTMIDAAFPEQKS